jgi:gliding motility-associated-like protein
MRKELLVFLAFIFLQCGVQAQCPIINMAMVNSCGVAEGPNEFLAFTTTVATTVGSYKLYYGSNNPPSSPTNTLSGAAARTQNGTGSIVAAGCNIVYVTNSTTIIPTDSRVVFIPSDFDQKYDLSALCYGGNIYVVFIDRAGSTPTWSSGGNFSNNPGTSTNRYIQLTNSANNCASEIRSYKTGWSSNLDGNFVSWNSAGVATYGNNGCDFNSLPSITPQTIAPICLGTTAVSMDFTTTGTPDKYSIVWDAAAITDGFTNITLAALTASPLTISIPTTATATVYSGTITVTNSTNSTTSLPQSFSITINPLPAIPTLNVTQPTCAVSTGTITVTPVAGITYSIDGINFSASTSFTGLVQGNYTITAKSAAGCTSTSTATINAPLAAPAAPTVVTPISYCQNATATALTATGTNLTWYTTATATTGSSTAPIPSTATAGSTIYYVTQTVSGCESPKAAITVQVNPLPATPTINITQPTCTVSTGSITIAPVAGLTYSITGSNFSGLAQGNYTITTTSTAGCTSITTVTINAPLAAPAAPTVVTPINYCQNATATALTATGTNLTWYTTATATTGSAIAPIPSTATAGSTIYYVTQTVSGCESPKAAITVQVNPLPTAPVTVVTQPTCAISTGTITITPVAGITYSIDGINFSASTSFTGLAQGNYTITAKSAAGCTATSTATINAPLAAPAIPTVISPITYCQNATAMALTATGANLTWYTTATATTGSTTAPIPSTATAGSTIYYVTQTVTGCESPKAAITVQVNPLPATPTINITQPTCAISTGTITITQVAGLTYSIDGINFSATTSFTGLAQGNYTIYAKSTAGCNTKTSATINAPLAVPTAPTVVSPITYCQNATATALTATGANLTWYTTATATTGSTTPPIPSTATAGSTIYYVTQTVTGCESPKAAITVQVSAPSASTINATICNGSSYILNGINYNAAGTYTAKLTNRAGCDSIVTLNLTVATFKLTLTTTNNPIYAGSPFAAKIAGTSTIVNSYWQPPSLFVNDQSQQNITAPNASFILKVLGVSANGCKDSITQPITIISPNKIVYIPNAIAPGSSGGDDVTTFKIYGTYIKSATMYIYNQWGQLIFQNENPLNIGWDGKYKGVAQPSGVYMYAVKITYLDDTKETKSGTINLIR